METAKIVSASLTSVGIVSLIFTGQIWIKVFSALISFISVFVSAFFKSFDLQTMVSAHKSTANRLLSIRDNLKMLLLRIKLQQDTVIELTKQFEKLIKTLNGIYIDAPNTTDKAVEQARNALNITQDNSFSDKKIDSYLPESLKKKVNE